MSFRKWLVHTIAYCQECKWTDGDHTTAQKGASAHHKKTGHAVYVETEYCGEYKK